MDKNAEIKRLNEKTMDDRYSYETYDMARFSIPEGLYSIEEVENMLAIMKKSKKRQDQMLEASLKSNNT